MNCSLSAFTNAYIAESLRTSFDENDQPLDQNYTQSDILPVILLEMRIFCRNFYENNEAHIWCDNGPNNQIETAGRDFWLTQNGYGAGFGDGDWPEPCATILSDAAEEFQNTDLYLGDDGIIRSS